LWTDVPLAVGATLCFRLRFVEPAEAHGVVGVVVWSVAARASEGCCHRAGVEWLGATRACRERLRELAGRAVPPAEREQYLFQAPWRIGDEARGA